MAQEQKYLRYSFQKVHLQRFSIQVHVITIATINPLKFMQNASQCIETLN